MHDLLVECACGSPPAAVRLLRLCHPRWSCRRNIMCRDVEQARNERRQPANEECRTARAALPQKESISLRRREYQGEAERTI